MNDPLGWSFTGMGPCGGRSAALLFRRAGGGSFGPDDEGLEFECLDAAERAAAEAAAEIGRDRLPKGDARDVAVEVRNEHGQRVLTVTVAMEIHRVDPALRRP